MEEKLLLEHWARTANHYDREKLLMRDYRAMLQAACDALPFEPDEAFTVLDLGAGTGSLAEAVLRQFPRARITCLDAVPEMLELARAKLGDRASYLQADLNDERIPGFWDAIVSGLCVYCLADDRKQALFRAMHGALTERGAVIIADIFAHPSRYAEGRQAALNRRHVERVIADGLLTPEEAEAPRRRWQAGGALPKHFSYPDRYTAWLRDAGFTSPEVVWQSWALAVVAAGKNDISQRS